MTIEPIINAKFAKYKEQYELDKMGEDAAFEQYVNYSILYQHQPDAFTSDTELLSSICIGGSGDLGLDGIAIKVNGCLIKSIEEVERLSKSGFLDIEFLFIQSKNKAKLDRAGFLKFKDGISMFFSDKVPEECNATVREWITIKNEIYTSYLYLLNKNPIIRCYYVYLGKNENSSSYEKESVKELENKLKDTFCSEFYFNFVDKNVFNDILNRNANKFNVTLTTIDYMGFEGVENVDDAGIALINASDFMPLLDTKEGIIKKSIFNDNVRDYQGDNSVNKEIMETIVKNPSRFILLNNGITIVCSKFISANRRITVENPQVVNGCQTCNVIYHAMKSNPDEAKNIALVLKVISTGNDIIANEIVRGTNRQTLVPEEAFEGIKPFHKELEEFINAYQNDFSDKIYYERRAKQYANTPSIKPIQIVTLKTLTQLSVGVLLRKPFLSHLHESILLSEFDNVLFKKSDSKLHYFAVMYSFYTLETLLRTKLIDKFYCKFKAHLIMIYFKIVAGEMPFNGNEKQVDEYAEKILSSLYCLEKASENFNKAISIFNQSNAIWVNDMKRSKYALKDVSEFTELLLLMADGKSYVTLKERMRKQAERKEGVLIYISIKKRMGYISSGENRYYFSFGSNNKLDFQKIKTGQRLSFEVSSKDYKGRVQALKIRLV